MEEIPIIKKRSDSVQSKYVFPFIRCNRLINFIRKAGNK